MKRTHLVAFLAIVSSRAASAGTLLSFDFNGPATPWPAAATDVMPSTPLPVQPSVELKPVGSIDVAKSLDVAKSSVASCGLAFTVEVGDVKTPWEAILVSGPLALKNVERDLAKLTLSLDLAASTARPVKVIVESLDAQRQRTGGLETMLYPAGPEFLQRFAVDLSTMTPSGAGTFDAGAAFVQLSVVVAGPAWPANATHVIRIDNVALASPTFYVSPKGSDANDGRTEARPLATPQKAVDLAKPATSCC